VSSALPLPLSSTAEAGAENAVAGYEPVRSPERTLPGTCRTGWITAPRRPRCRRCNSRIRPSDRAPNDPAALGIASDPEIDEQLRQLRLIELRDLRPGVDLRRDAYAVAHRPELRLQLEQSDELVDSLPGHVRFRAKRRRGILRHSANEPAWEGLPFFLPSVPPVPEETARNQVVNFHLGVLVDELEILWIPVFSTNYGFRPIFSTVNSVIIRATLGVSAAWFYEMSRNRGYLFGRLPSRNFDTETLMRAFFTGRLL